jgi:hypothetical protein
MLGVVGGVPEGVAEVFGVWAGAGITVVLEGTSIGTWDSVLDTVWRTVLGQIGTGLAMGILALSPVAGGIGVVAATHG